MGLFTKTIPKHSNPTFNLHGVNWIIELADSFARWQKQAATYGGLLCPSRWLASNSKSIPLPNFRPRFVFRFPGAAWI
jgi:hypothetical protein